MDSRGNQGEGSSRHRVPRPSLSTDPAWGGRSKGQLTEHPSPLAGLLGLGRTLRSPPTILPSPLSFLPSSSLSFPPLPLLLPTAECLSPLSQECSDGRWKRTLLSSWGSQLHPQRPHPYPHLADVETEASITWERLPSWSGRMKDGDSAQLTSDLSLLRAACRDNTGAPRRGEVPKKSVGRVGAHKL